MALIAALAAVALHVANYNFTAQVEHRTRVFTKLIGRNAVYIYAAYLVASAALRDKVIEYALLADEGSFPVPAAHLLGATLFILGILLNLWTLHALGIKGMYNGDSFGWLMDAPVTTGPYIFFNDPQYVGTTAAMFGSALYYQSLSGVLLTAWMGVVFYVSVKFIEVLFFSLPEFEKYLFWYVDPPTIAYFLLFFLAFSLRFQGPHMSRLYSPAARKHNKLY